MSPGTLALLAVGLTALFFGAEALVRGAARLAATFGVSPLVIGLTVVAWGTGSPELAVGIKAAFQGQPDITIGNVVGSNIANVLLILGLAALITPLAVRQRLIRLDVPLTIGLSMVTLVLSLDGTIGRWDGLLLLAGIVAYTVWSIHESRRALPEVRAQYEEEFGAAVSRRFGQITAQAGMVAAGLVLLVLGSRWLVDAASAIAAHFGFSELIIGLTIVAIGTSLPEMATSLWATARGERDIAVGNAVGSNIFNILAVLGITAMLAPEGIAVSAAAVSFDIPVMIAVAIACLPIFFSDNLIDRWEGALFLGCYAGYIAYLIFRATEHDNLSGFTTIMLLFVLPLTAITLAIIMYRALRDRSAA